MESLYVALCFITGFYGGWHLMGGIFEGDRLKVLVSILLILVTML